MSNLDKNVFEYFFRHVFAGDRGIRYALINTFFDKFYTACIAEGVPPEWDPTVYDKVKLVLERLNFDEKIEVPVTKPAKKSRTK